MNKWIEKLFGIDKIRAEAEAQAKLSPKERATRKKEPWVGVIETHVNKDNVRNLSLIHI